MLMRAQLGLPDKGRAIKEFVVCGTIHDFLEWSLTGFNTAKK